MKVWFSNRSAGVILPALVVLGGLAVGGAGAWWLQDRAQAEAEQDFQRLLRSTSAEITERVRKPVYGLNGARGAYATHDEVRRDTFRAYVASRNLPTEFPGVRGFGFIERVPREAQRAFVAAARADGAPQFAVRQLELKDQSDLFVIKYIEPAERNSGAMGLDVGSEAVRRAGAELAIETGEPTLSGVVELVQDQRRSPGVLLYVPHFTPGPAAGTLGALKGIFYAPIVLAELLDGLGDVAAGQVHVDLLDTASGTLAGPTMFSSSPDQAAGTTDAAGATPAAPSRFESMHVLHLPGRMATLRLRSTPAFDAAHHTDTPAMFFVSLLVASLLLAGLLRQMATGRRRAEALAEHMTADLTRLAMVARRTTNAVVITDKQRRITWVNEGFERISGYTAAEAMGRSPGALLQSEATDPTTVQRLRTALDAGEPFTCELLNRGKHGQHYWLSIEIQPLHDKQGSLTGFMAVEVDITAQKDAERELSRQRQSLANIIDGTSVGTWEWNVETGQTVFNERWAQIVGCTLAELQPTGIDTWSRLSHPDDLSRSAVLLEQHFNGETPAYECEARMRHKDGHWVWVLDRGKLFSRSSDGRPRWMAGTHMDITERKQAEAALRASQAFLDKTGRIGGVGGWELDLETQVIAWSDETCRIHDLPTGHGPTLAEALDFYTPQSRPLIQAAVQRCIDSGEGFDLELHVNTAAGRRICVRAVGEAERLEGRTVRIVGAFQDITARREMEAEVRHNHALLQTVLASLPCGLSVFDGELRLVVGNPEFGRLLELPERLCVAGETNFEDIIRFNAARGEYGDGDVEATVQAIVARAREPATPHQFERTRPNGTVLEVRGGPMAGGGFVTTYTDVSARHRAEAEAQRSGQLLRGAIDAIDEAFVLYDPDDRLVLCNDKYREIYAGVADLIVTGARFEDIVRAGAERGHYLAAHGRVDAWVAERVAAHQRANSTLVQKLDSGKTLRIIERKLPDGHIVGFRIDITELVGATEAAQQASQAKSQFLATMSHEIRTPMNAILGMLALLKKTTLTPRQTDYAEKTEGAARSLLGLLNDILDFSKVEAGKMTLDPNPFRIDQLMRDLAVILSANVGAKPVEVLFDIDPRLPRRLLGDAMRLQQVLINLAGNAIKFTASGEVVVSVEVLDEADAEVTLRVAVRDTGIGIAPENQARIFSGFTQAEASTTRRFGGTGLGVAISQRLVTLMGGQLQLDSALGQGTTFHFCITLPRVAGDDDEPAHEPAQRPLRTLVVDDNATAREVLERMTAALGWEVDSADSGERALALLSERAAAGARYDAVFVDWQMPGLDGWDTARAIREGKLAGEAPIVVMITAHGREMLGQRSEAEQKLLDGFLVKPVTASMLFDAIAESRPDHGLALAATNRAAPQGQRLAGLRLLLAEDNANNQQVARELLEDEGATVQIANHGQEAVEAVAAADPPFDVVLMDLHMPVMDGFTATRRIRQDLARTQLPIVAMTANAMASDREACLAAGMNDHVGKPFELDHLVRVLQRLAGRPTRADAARPAPSVALPGAVTDSAARAGVEIGRALDRLGGKLPVYERMLRTFTNDLAAMPQRLKEHFAATETEAATRLLHTLKGLAATLGSAALAESAAQGERALAQAPAREAMDAICAEACAAIEQAHPALQALLEALQAGSAAPDAPDAPESSAPLDPALLQELATLLENSDMRATELMARLPPQPGPAWRELDDAVANLDFDRALGLCRPMLAECNA